MHNEVTEIAHTLIIATIHDYKTLTFPYAWLFYLLTHLKCTEMFIASGYQYKCHVFEMITPTGLKLIYGQAVTTI